ncbi:MAG: terpene cyclase/mutase family protein [Planctomycetota bacterium]|nr:terpene cyclase/mutase family protein [Planctomycetota bacterium]
MRRVAYALPVVLVLVTLLAVLGPTQVDADDPGSRSGPLVNRQAREAIRWGTSYLVELQQADGSWPSDAGKKINETYDVFQNGKKISHVGTTSLAVLALLAGGHMPGRGPHGDVMERAIGFILSQVRHNGYIAGGGTRMYSHAFATLALAEVYGVSRTERVREKLQLAVEFTVKCQNATGGWRYVPFTNDSDMSVTVCQIVALRAARNVGIKVPRATIDRALSYIIQSAISENDHPPGPKGAYWYQPYDKRFNRPSFALCAAGLTAMFQAGLYDDDQVRSHIKRFKIRRRSAPPAIADSVDYMDNAYWQVWHRRGHMGPDHYFFYYGNYYGAQAMYQIGGQDPARWRSWYTRVRDHLLERMNPVKTADGKTQAFWRSNVDDTNAYATACALLILQFPLDYLPIHQR